MGALEYLQRALPLLTSLRHDFHANPKFGFEETAPPRKSLNCSQAGASKYAPEWRHGSGRSSARAAAGQPRDWLSCRYGRKALSARCRVMAEPRCCAAFARSATVSPTASASRLIAVSSLAVR